MVWNLTLFKETEENMRKQRKIQRLVNYFNELASVSDEKGGFMHPLSEKQKIKVLLLATTFFEKIYVFSNRIIPKNLEEELNKRLDTASDIFNKQSKNWYLTVDMILCRKSK